MYSKTRLFNLIGTKFNFKNFNTDPGKFGLSRMKIKQPKAEDCSVFNQCVLIFTAPKQVPQCYKSFSDEILGLSFLVSMSPACL
jgi:hypothetical protein